MFNNIPSPVPNNTGRACETVAIFVRINLNLRGQMKASSTSSLKHVSETFSILMSSRKTSSHLGENNTLISFAAPYCTHVSVHAINTTKQFRGFPFLEHTRNTSYVSRKEVLWLAGFSRDLGRKGNYYSFHNTRPTYIFSSRAPSGQYLNSRQSDNIQKYSFEALDSTVLT